MPPVGEGANLAMYDGAELAKAIVANKDNIKSALIRYEKEMFSRSRQATESAIMGLKICYGEQAPYSFVDFLSEQTV